MKREIKIGNRKIGEGHPVFIIAEAGVNHNGSLKTAKKMIGAARKAGADAVKFQIFQAQALATRTAPKADYQKKTGGASQLDMLKELELTAREISQLKKYCAKKRVLFLATPFDTESARLLRSMGAAAYKISSGDLTNIPLLKEIARYKKPVIISTGMADMDEVSQAVKAVRSSGNKKIVLMHCTSNYPAEMKDANLKAIRTLGSFFGVPAGYSDHTKGAVSAVAAVALGAGILEKHFTLSRKMKGPDHDASLEPGELRDFVRTIRKTEAALGSGKKTVAPSERKMRLIARKSIVASRDIQKCEKFTPENLTVKRPGKGIEPIYLEELMGKRAGRKIACDRALRWKDIIL